MSHYTPDPTPLDVTPEILADYLLRELLRVSESINAIHDMDVLHEIPNKPRDGMIRFYDGTDAGTSVGLHEYHTGVWNKL